MPNPFMKPWSRATSTVGWFSSASRKATWGVLVLAPSVLAAHAAMSRPALKLSVAKVASAASMGSSGVSRAMTRMPASRAFFTVGTMALVSLGVMRMPLAPAEMRFSMAATCVSLSPSNLPAKLCTRAPTFLAVASAPSRILTKKGLLSVLVMRPMKTSAALAGPAVPATRTATAASSQIADLEWSVMISSGKPRAPNPLPGVAACSLQAAALFGKPPCGEVMLVSAANGEELARRGLFAEGPVTLAIRANDTTDIWLPRGAAYSAEPSRPFRTASLERVRPFCDLGLYSMTFNNRLDRDHASLEAYARFREEALRAGFRHFLEVFNPNAPAGLAPEAVPSFVNDSVVRALAGVTSAERPLFLKIAYNGARALEELVEHDPSLIVGILGGAAGTTRDTFELLSQAMRHGARVALFGRKINLAESPLEMLGFMWRVVRGEVGAAEAVRGYHAALGKKGLRPRRSLEEDSLVTEPVLLPR